MQINQKKNTISYRSNIKNKDNIRITKLLDKDIVMNDIFKRVSNNLKRK